ncbi:hypothetical protein [Solimonas soli]|uniref:hypothetical protein n=1 Tax=Solimonas soli TaxID=413479 RepID=UPI0004AFFC05|nr:hypothetical protein [Solimonas soli]
MPRDGASLLAGLADGSLPASAFGHAEHVRAAWQCLRDTADAGEGQTRFCTLLRAYVTHAGAEARYHETMTVALLRLIDLRRRALPQADWPAFAAAHPELFADARALLGAHYSPAQLDSGMARSRFVEPDRLPLP